MVHEENRGMCCASRTVSNSSVPPPFPSAYELKSRDGPRWMSEFGTGSGAGRLGSMS
nr:hypothetical protein [uncultured bacterium]